MLKTKQSKIVFFILFSIVLVCVLFFFFWFLSGDNFSSIKENRREYLVYTKYEKKDDPYSILIPYINIRSLEVKQINEDIETFLLPFVENEQSIITYEYTIMGDVLSLLLKVMDYSTGYAPQPHFKSYHIQLSSVTVLTDEEVLSLFQTNSSFVSITLENQFHDFYQRIIQEGYYQEEECNYNCFLKFRGFDQYLDSVSYYIKQGSLYAYKPFIFYSIYGEENFFQEEDLEFFIAKAE